MGFLTAARPRGLRLILVAMSALSAVVWAADVRVDVESRPAYGETRYSATAGDAKAIGLTTYQTPVNRGVLHFRSRSGVSVGQQVEVLSELLTQVIRREGRSGIHTLFLGRLAHAFGPGNGQLSRRLAMAAHASDRWDPIRGRPVTGHENAAVQAIAGRADLFPELVTAFARQGLSLTVSGVEKVLVASPGEMPLGGLLAEGGLPSTARLPYDCLVWLAVAPVSGGVHLGGGYWKDASRVYWKWPRVKHPLPLRSGEAPAYTVREVLGADGDSFVFLAERVEGLWGADREAIYFFEARLEGVDQASWQPLDWGYSRDRYHVYRGTQRLDGVDPESFVVPEGG